VDSCALSDKVRSAPFGAAGTAAGPVLRFLVEGFAMALRATCPGCHKALSFPEASAGQKTRCPVCQTRFLITPDAAAASPAALPPPPAASPAAPSGQPAPRPQK
jgi:hypothetical protein